MEMDDDIWYNDDMEFDGYDDEMQNDWEEEMDAPSFQNMIHQCLIPTFNDVMTKAMTKLFLSCVFIKIIGRFANLGFFPIVVLHLTSIATGAWLAYQFFQKASVYLLLFTFLAYFIAYFANAYLKRRIGFLVSFYSVTYSIICELVIADEKHWHTVRGANMIMVMKIISLGFDLDNGSLPTFPSFLHFVSYCWSPCTVVFGPWINYNDYLKMMHRQGVENLWWILKFVKCFIYCLIYLSISTCWSPWLFGFSDISTAFSLFNKWLIAYGDALSYRCSHYFISYLSESSITIAGFHQDVKVTQPLMVELPRSLVEVVIFWNFPMHFWLKTYVFKIVRTRSAFLAIFLTYAASSLLHGLNFQLAAVLLSLGFHTYVEFELRNKLSNIFSACIKARPCRVNCHHYYKSSHQWVMVSNFVFSVMSLFHLTYLGLMFDSNPSIEEKGYDMKHTLEKWGELGYASHWLAAFCFIFNFLLR